MRFEAQGFTTRYGSGLFAELTAGLDSWLVVTQPEPWAVVSTEADHPPEQVVTAGDLSPEHLELLVDTLPPVDAIVGVGGGSAMDTAKWIAWRRGVSLHNVPSVPSVNACFTRMVALRDVGGVRYEGDAVPEAVWVDFDLMRSAEAALVRGGIGDVLSCHTARFDWRLAVDAGVEDHPWDEGAAQMSLNYLAELSDLAPELAERTDDGIRRLMELHRDVGWRCHELRHARFEEGSEHFFAYTFEAVTGRTIMHGELVALGVLVMSAIQANDPTRPRAICDAARMRTGLDELGVTWAEIVATLRRLPSFVEEQQLWFSVCTDLTVDDSTLDLAAEALGI